jgi:hypothetical protein
VGPEGPGVGWKPGSFTHHAGEFSCRGDAGVWQFQLEVVEWQSCCYSASAVHERLQWRLGCAAYLSTVSITTQVMSSRKGGRS